MKSKWKNIYLTEAPIKIIDGDRGKNYPNGSDFSDDGYCLFLNAKNVTSGGFSFEENMFISKSKDQLLHNGKLERYDTVLTTRGTVGNVAFYGEDIPYDNIRINSGMVIFRGNQDFYNPEFLYWMFRSNLIQDQIKILQSGTAQPQLPISSMMQMRVVQPILEIQNSIIPIMSNLQRKIELNNKINANLEQQAQAIFKSWFVDFEPFQDGEFVDSELGKIPIGWKVRKLGDICSVITKGTTPTTLKKQFTNSGINFIKAESILPDHSIDYSKVAFIDNETNILLRRSIINKDDILFTIAGTLGRFCIATKEIIPANTNQAIAIIRANKDFVSPIILYSYFIGGWHEDFYIKNIQQAVQANLSLTTIKNLSLILPKRETLSIYSELIYPIFAQIFNNIVESEKLKAIRDTLLPKLMSGEIEV